MSNVKLLIIALFALAAAACRKDFSGIREPKRRVDSTKVYRIPSTSGDSLLVDNLRKVTDVLKELYKKRVNLKLVNAAIFAKVYTDESILLKDLIYPEKSRLQGSASFQTYVQKCNTSLDQFSHDFWGEAEKKGDPAFMGFLKRLNNAGASARSGSFSNSNIGELEASIYFPYSEGFPPPEEGHYEPITSLVTATADADEGWGSQPYYINGILQSYVQVLINDDYAYSNPTQIVGVNGVEPYTATTATNSIFPPGEPVDLPSLTREVKQVYIGEVRVNGHQYDHLISFTGNGGGSEIRFTRADGFLKVVDGQVQTADVYFTPAREISRNDIKHARNVDFSVEWDGDWEASNLQQNLGIYEEDNRNTSTFNGSLSTTVTATLTPVTVTAVRTLGFTINYKSDDELIRQLNFNRDVFFTLNHTNLEGEMRNGWPVRDRQGPVSYTLSDRTYY